MNRSLGKSIRILRQAREWKLNQLASESNLSVPYLSLVETGERQPSLKSISAIANALGIPADTLVLMGIEATSKLESHDSGVLEITRSVEQLIEIEEDLKKLLSKERADEESR